MKDRDSTTDKNPANSSISELAEFYQKLKNEELNRRELTDRIVEQFTRRKMQQNH